jgi:hypothetical protein
MSHGGFIVPTRLPPSNAAVASHEDRRLSQFDTPFEELDVEIRSPPLRFRGSREDLSLVLDDVVAADNLVAERAVATVIEVDFGRLAQQGSIHFADDLAVFTELEIPREKHANCYEQPAPRRESRLKLRRRPERG